MGNINFELEEFYMIKDLYDEIEASINNKKEINIIDVAKKLSYFCFSEKFIPFLSGKTKIDVLFFIIMLYEKKEKYLSLKIYFPLLEELKKQKFEANIEAIYKLFHGESQKLQNIRDSYINNHKEFITDFKKSEKYVKAKDNIIKDVSNNYTHILNLYMIYLYILFFEFNLIKDLKRMEPNKNPLNSLYDIIQKYVDVNIVYDYFKNKKFELKSYSFFIFVLNVKKNEKKISLLNNIDDDFFNIYDIDLVKNGEFLWTIYKEDINQSIPEKKYIKTKLIGKKTEKEKFNIDLFENINEIKPQKNLTGITGYIFKSLFSNDSKLIIKLNLNYYTKNKIKIEQILNEIKIFKESCTKEYNKLDDVYIQIKKTIINLNSSNKILLDTLNLNMNSLNFIDFYKSFESSTNNNQNLNLEFLAKQLFLFCSNENFISLFYESMIKMKDSIPPILNILLSIYEKKGKYFSLGVFFLLLEEMKKYNFDEKIKEITDSIMKGKESVVNKYNLYSKDELNLEECKKCIKFDIDNYIKENNKFLRQFFIFYSGIFVYSFYDIFSQTFPDTYKEKIFSNIFSNLKDLNKYLKDGMNNFISKYININISLNHTKSVYQNFLFLLNLINKENEITLKDKIDRKFFENLNINEPLNLNDKLTWILYKEDLKSKPEKKYIKTILEGKINEKDKFNYDIFDCINKPKESDNIKYMKAEIFKSIFNNKNVLVILLDFDYLKKNKQKLEQIQDNISLIQKSLPSEFSHLDTYIQIENKIINYDVSFDLFTQELKNQKLIEVNASHEINKQKDKNELKALKLELNKEKEKNQKLERELIIEKNKNKGNKVQEQKVSSTETIKDKKIKELETKLSRFPFTLEEGEELMSIMFVSSEQKLYYSTICKNTDGFRKIEEELYKKFPQYFENDITFRLNGKKINRFKTLGENGIKNNDIIEMKEVK